MENEPRNESIIIEELNEKLFTLRFTKNTEIANFAGALREKYGEKEVDKYTLFHVMGGSSGYEDVVELFDFPGEDSIEAFIRSL